MCVQWQLYYIKKCEWKQKWKLLRFTKDIMNFKEKKKGR